MYVDERNPAFRSQFASNIFNKKYAHENASTWSELARTMVEDVCRNYLSTSIKNAIFEMIRDMKFVPGGRYLYYAGREIKAFNNCLSGDTQLLTTDGMRRMDSYIDGQQLALWSPIAKAYLPAIMRCHGEQSLNEITFRPKRGRSDRTWVVKATADHKWPTLNRGPVEDLRVGDYVGFADVDLGSNETAFVHGLVFADGSVGKRCKEHFGHQLRLCGDKARFAGLLERHGHSVTYPSFSNGDPVAYVRSPYDLKQLPVETSPGYVAAFLKGWAALDGHHGLSKRLHSIDRPALEFFEKYAHLGGMIITGTIREMNGPTNYAPQGRKTLYYVAFHDAGSVGPIKVVGIKALAPETVWCPFEPKHNRIVIDGGIDTFQCYLLRSEEDTREDWAMLSWKAESCLATGGGIGNDYSRYRGKNSPLRRTGGVASGPVSKMRMINEIGREVMQGGSRRSAIYASLNWQHTDAKDLLTAKNWADQMIPGTTATFADAKMADFNFPCPLDMTNISLNYDNAWRDGDRLNDTFMRNVTQALRTGEPGFSFNFDAKENETLRNACTEVTSEDDSDVCNLGSLNMARIETIHEFGQCAELASMLLLCGTMVADLPYEKVRKVREKNRRLGLGLMGVHEWLVQRGYRYEFNPELHQWAGVYMAHSESAAISLATAMGISRPIAFRAIAPTGTIAILAGTTTGIEPIFAVAYKRRYLQNGTDWAYEYVVDAAAKDLIDRYAVDPDSIETALDLAADPERRIAFQADLQDYVDQAISSTINLPAWGSDLNNPDTVRGFGETLARYAPRLRGFTAYPDGGRGGQPLTSVSYEEAKGQVGQVFVEAYDACTSGVCGI